ncbi:MAG: orotidine-5'-phosphate decarboxylase [Candidatus Thermoplasmatota archaeon]|nr:orotidine-5'-phosphate decarboxylase [Candidatus Thermoplasmatota archaeon]MBU1940535.1 orotidine-5'-phosphate decarboxylase [Candidatus Thermoplasmatota archaeon]
MRFNDKLKNIIEKNNSILCVGLDIDAEKIPQYLHKIDTSPLLTFNHAIIDATHDLVCAYKINLAFYEQYGLEGMQLLHDTLKHIPKDIVIILDGKRNDIGNSAAKYATALYDILHADGVTLNPYLGIDGITPFLKYTDKCNFILCRTSNSSARDFQDLQFQRKPLFEHVAHKIVSWNKYRNCGAVVGATYPKELKKIREIFGDTIPLLIPGVGKQGGDVEKTIIYGTNSEGKMAIINSSRGIIYADTSEKFAESARETAQTLQTTINSFRYRKVH